MNTREQNAPLRMAHITMAIAIVLLGWTSVMGAAAMNGAGRTFLDAITIGVVATLALSSSVLTRKGRKLSSANEGLLKPTAKEEAVDAGNDGAHHPEEAARETATPCVVSCRQAEEARGERAEAHPSGENGETNDACFEFSCTFGLSLRERDVLRLLATGMSGKEIAQELTLSYNTVKSHIRHIYEKAGVHRKQDLIDLVYQREALGR